MTYKEALFFIGKCLALGHCPVKTEDVRNVIRSGSVVWEQVVWVSTDQIVFSALYVQLKRAGLLQELPTDLVEYMVEFISLNRKRNLLIIDQAYEITELLNQQGITPIFLKGVGHVMDGLYEDIGERQIGDIDILVDENNMVKAADLLITEGYVPFCQFDPGLLKTYRHYPRLNHNNRIAAVEIHRQISNSASNDIELISREARMLNIPFKALVMSNQNQIVHNILNVQINDKGYYYGKIFFRQIYDLLLLSRRENPLESVKSYGRYFHQMNVNLALADQLHDHPGTLPFQFNWRAKLFLSRVYFKTDHPGWMRFSNGFLYLLFRFGNSTNYIFRAIYDRSIRKSVYNRIGNPQWYLNHLKSYK